MKREIIFRGKVKGGDDTMFTKGWIFGSLIQKSEGSFIHMIDLDENGEPEYEFEVEVIPDSVGQYIGLTDRDGLKIFEGDIMQKTYIDMVAYKKMNFEGDAPLEVINIDYVDISKFRLWLRKENFGVEGDELQESYEYRIVGNMTDNKELMKLK